MLPPLATAGIVILFVIFILLQREDLRDRLIRLMGASDMQRASATMNDAATRLSRYFLRQVLINATFGAFIALGLWAIGVPSPVAWGILAMLMRFVPYVGSFIAAAPPMLLAAVIEPGWTTVLLTGGLFLGSEMVMGQVVEPLVYGHGTGLSPIAVILSTVFWTWLWGPLGLLLAMPLTVCVVVLGRHVEGLELPRSPAWRQAGADAGAKFLSARSDRRFGRGHLSGRAFPQGRAAASVLSRRGGARGPEARRSATPSAARSMSSIWRASTRPWPR